MTQESNDYQAITLRELKQIEIKEYKVQADRLPWLPSSLWLLSSF